jgi:uncharacterized protein (TIGR03435 family)
MRCRAALLAFAFLAALPAQTPPAFEVATVQPSNPAVREGKQGVTTDPIRLTARRVTLKELIFEAYNAPYYRITGGPSWLDSDQFDIDAKSEAPADHEQIRRMLQSLLADRFKLAIHHDTKEMRVYALSVAKGGPLIHPVKDDDPPIKPASMGAQHFHSDLAHFATILSVKLSIPLIQDPTSPSRSTGALIPVLDQTNLPGTYDFDVALTPEPDGDSITAWQRALQQQLGLKLEAQRAPVDLIVVDHAEKVMKQ